MVGTVGGIIPAPMEGDGAYNRNSQVQAAGLLPAIALLQQAASTVDLPPGLITLADYGASAGHNSMLPLAAAIDTLRARPGGEGAMSILHTDLPENDFSALFRTLAGDPQSYLIGRQGLYPAAVGQSFYRQILPPGSVTLGWSSWAVQWLSRAPCAIPDQIQVAYSRDSAARAAYAAQAERDWRDFLQARGAELRPGGALVNLTMAVDDSGDFGYRPLLQALYRALLAMADSGFLRMAEVQAMAVPTVGRSRADFLAPFAGGSFAGLEIAHLEVFKGEDHIWAGFQATGDAQTFGAQWAAFTRASIFPTLAVAMDSGAGDPRRGDFMDRLEAAVAADLAAAPAQMLIPLAKMVLRKG